MCPRTGAASLPSQARHAAFSSQVLAHYLWEHRPTVEDSPAHASSLMTITHALAARDLYLPIRLHTHLPACIPNCTAAPFLPAAPFPALPHLPQLHAANPHAAAYALTAMAVINYVLGAVVVAAQGAARMPVAALCATLGTARVVTLAVQPDAAQGVSTGRGVRERREGRVACARWRTQ